MSNSTGNEELAYHSIKYTLFATSDLSLYIWIVAPYNLSNSTGNEELAYHSLKCTLFTASDLLQQMCIIGSVEFEQLYLE